MTQERKEPQAIQNATSQDDIAGSNEASIPLLMENIGTLFDSAFSSLAEMVDSVNSLTGQITDNVSSTVNSESVQNVIEGLNTASQSLLSSVNSTIEGVNTALESKELKETFDSLGQLWNTVTESFDSVVQAVPVQEIIENVSAGIGQVTGNVGGMVFQQHSDTKHPKAVEIPFTHKDSCCGHESKKTSADTEKNHTNQPLQENV
ncbi:hypothetical protein [Prosthecochloris sp.]|uniref:hypothetical protein n=1 Tax=Prosthecochloris sp. TaxID=290513 RepID=UPI0025F92649|nr:hypothetical protein [Prosthecochloris sp.]